MTVAALPDDGRVLDVAMEDLFRHLDGGGQLDGARQRPGPAPPPVA